MVSQECLVLPNAQLSRPRDHNAPALVGRAEWDATSESLWCVLNKLLALNDLRPATARALLLTKTRKELEEMERWERDAARQLNTPENFRRKILIASTNLTPETYPLSFPRAFDPDTSGSSELVYCDPCLRSGFHSALFHTGITERCPWHNVPLRTGCPTCGLAIANELPNRKAIDPFRCANGHLLWPGLHEGVWSGGPSATQRQELVAAYYYLEKSAKSFGPQGGSRYAVVGGLARSPGWSPLFQTLQPPPAILTRLARPAESYFEVVTAPVGLDTRKQVCGKHIDEFWEPAREFRIDNATLRSLPGPRYFYDSFLNVGLIEYQRFYNEMDALVERHHTNCCIGLAQHQYSISWNIIAEHVCVWRAALALMRGVPKYRFRDFKSAESTKRAMSYTETFFEMYKHWERTVRGFLIPMDEGCRSFYNVEFCRWIYRLSVRRMLEQVYIAVVEEVFTQLETSNPNIREFSEPFSGWFHALVDFSPEMPVLTLSSDQRSFARAIEACRRSLHDAARIKAFMTHCESPHVRQNTHDHESGDTTKTHGESPR